MSSTKTIFPKAFLEHHNSIRDEERLKLELAGYLMKISLNNSENTIFKRGDD